MELACAGHENFSKNIDSLHQKVFIVTDPSEPNPEATKKEEKQKKRQKKLKAERNTEIPY